MLVVVLLGAAMIATWTWALWPRTRPSAPAGPSSHSAGPSSRPAGPSPHLAGPSPHLAGGIPHPAVVPLPRMQSTEGLLVAQLFRGELTGPQFRRAMETLAARDADRHPITIPGDGV